MDCEPWRYACGPGGHYYDKCCPSISSSCFKNSKTPTRRVVYEYVVTHIGGSLYVSENGALKNLDGLRSLESVRARRPSRRPKHIATA